MTLNVCFDAVDRLFQPCFEATEQLFALDLGVVTATVAGSYDGQYVLSPERFDQTLPTKEKTLADDVTLLAVPVGVVDNPEGGRTFTIGG